MMKMLQTGTVVVAGLAVFAVGLALRPQSSIELPANASQSARVSQTAFRANSDAKGKAEKPGNKVTKIVKTEAEWKKLLTAEEFYVLRQKGTQAPFSGDYHPKKIKGTYQCAACALTLFRADTQFDSGTGWPSFWQPIAGHVEEHTDADGDRTEILCARCDGHLGHVFNDGPKPTGLRYCMNAVALKFEAQK